MADISYVGRLAVSALSDHDNARGAIIDKAVHDNAVKLDDRLRMIEKQNAAELARFPAAPAPKASKAK